MTLVRRRVSPKVRSMKLGYAEVPHNHRYSLASVILNGGFVHHILKRNGRCLGEVADVRRSYQRGDAYIVGYDQIHKLSC